MSSSTVHHHDHDSHQVPTQQSPRYPANSETATLDLLELRQTKLEKMDEKRKTARGYLLQHKKDLIESHKRLRSAETRLRNAAQKSENAEQKIKACEDRIEALKPSETSGFIRGMKNKPRLLAENKALDYLKRGLHELREERDVAQAAVDRAKHTLDLTEATDPGGIYAIAQTLRAMVPYKPGGDHARFHDEYVEQNKLLRRLCTKLDDVMGSEGFGPASGLPDPIPWRSGCSSRTTL